MGIQQQAETQGVRLLNQLFLQGNRIFDIEDVTAASSVQNIPLNQIHKILSSLSQHKRILRLRRGLYLMIGLDQHMPHAFVISSYLLQPSAISHLSALQHHGLTEQIPTIITASTPKKVLTPSMREQSVQKLSRKHAWVIEDVRYEYMTVKEDHFFGTEKIWLDEHFQVNITDKERTIIDVFVSPKMFGGIGEALGVLKNSLADIDIEKLVSYAILYNKKSLIKRLGWALEYFGVSDKYFKNLLQIPIHYYCLLDVSGPEEGLLDKRWMIRDNLKKVE